VLAFCRTGTRSTTLWALSEAGHLDPDAILATAAEAGYDLSALKPRLDLRWRTAGLASAPGRVVEFGPTASHDVVIVGGAVPQGSPLRRACCAAGRRCRSR
jgi:sulfide:quinone oxidoreductase